MAVEGLAAGEDQDGGEGNLCEGSHGKRTSGALMDGCRLPGGVVSVRLHADAHTLSHDGPARDSLRLAAIASKVAFGDRGVRLRTGSARPRASVVICAYTENRWDDLVHAIDSVITQDPQPSEVIVVVDHNPALKRRLDATMTGVQILASEGRPGLSAARNTGAAGASGDIVIFLDDDARARPGWLGALLAAYRPGVIGAGGVAVAKWDRGRPAWFPEEFDWVVGCTYRGHPTRQMEIRNPIGANMSFERQALKTAGPFDDRLGRIGTRPVGAEETELSLRARAAIPGSRIMFAPGAVVDHRVPRSRASLGYFISRCFGEGLSKAVLVDLAGSASALATERRYVRSVLPAGVLKGVRDLLRGDLEGGRRAVAIILGLAATAAGYAWGRAFSVHRRSGAG